MPTLPTTDAFEQAAWRQAQPLEYLRGRVDSTTFLDSSPILERASGEVRASAGILTGFLYRRVLHDGDSFHRVRAQFLSGGGSTNVRCGVVSRGRPLNYTSSATANRSDWFAGLSQGYVALVDETGAAVLYRASAGVLTSIGTAAVTVTPATLYNIGLTCQTIDAATVYVAFKFDGTTPIEVYDTNAARPTLAGHEGFVLEHNATGPRRWAVDTWRLQDPAQAVTYLEDDFLRPAPVLVTYGAVEQPALMWEFGDLSQSAGGELPAYDSDRLAVAGAATGLSTVDLYQRTPASADQHTEARIQFEGMSQNPSHLAGVVVRGTKTAQGTGSTNFTGYAAMIAPGSPSGASGLRLIRYVAGTATNLALVRRPVPADKWIRLALEVATNGANADLTVLVDDVELVTYSDSSPVAGPGLQGIAWKFSCLGASCVNSGRILFDDFAAAAATPATPSFGGEPAIFGDLPFRAEAPEDVLPGYQVTRYEFERGYRASWATYRRPRAAWRGVRWIADATDAATIYDFLVARLGDAQALTLDGAWAAGKAWLLVPGRVRKSLIGPGIYEVGPVDLVERLDVTAVP